MLSPAPPGPEIAAELGEIVGMNDRRRSNRSSCLGTSSVMAPAPQRLLQAQFGRVGTLKARVGQQRSQVALQMRCDASDR